MEVGLEDKPPKQLKLTCMRIETVTNLVMTIGMIYVIFVLLLSTVALVYLAFVGFHVMVRTELTPRTIKQMKAVSAPVGLTTEDIARAVEQESLRASVLGFQKVGKA